MANGVGEADVYPGNDRSKTPIHYTFSIDHPSFVQSAGSQVRVYQPAPGSAAWQRVS